MKSERIVESWRVFKESVFTLRKNLVDQGFSDSQGQVE